MKTLNDIPTSELAAFLKVTMPYVSNIKAGRTKVSAKVAQRIHAEYSIPLWELRPDIYPEAMFNQMNVKQA